MEIWKDVIGYEGLYKVSNEGRVKSLDRIVPHNDGGYQRIRGRLLTIRYREKDGYLQIGLWKDGNKKTVKVHRLVAEAFIENPEGLPEVNHKDEVRTNNCADNLEWCTQEYNLKYGTRMQRIRAHRAIHRRKPVLQISMEGNAIKEWESAASASRELNIDSSHIIKSARGKIKTAGGFVWRYANKKAS